MSIEALPFKGGFGRHGVGGPNAETHPAPVLPLKGRETSLE